MDFSTKAVVSPVSDTASRGLAEIKLVGGSRPFAPSPARS